MAVSLTTLFTMSPALRYKLVYRQELQSPFAVTPPPGPVTFALLRGSTDGARILRALRRRYGQAGAAKTLVKLATPIRELYVVLRAGVIVHDGWLMRGRCEAYPIEAHAFVIGPIWTDPQWRGMGLATYGMQRAMNELLAARHRVFYIDAASTNLPSHRAIAKAGFGDPVAVQIIGNADR